MTMENEAEINMKPMVFWGVGIFLLTVLMSLYAWFTLPAGAQIATHWGLEGRPDGWSDKTSGLAIIPIMELVVIGVYLFALKFHAQTPEYCTFTWGYQDRGFAVPCSDILSAVTDYTDCTWN